MTVCAPGHLNWSRAGSNALFGRSGGCGKWSSSRWATDGHTHLILLAATMQAFTVTRANEGDWPAAHHVLPFPCT
jgi:hypothetical protein